MCHEDINASWNFLPIVKALFTTCELEGTFHPELGLPEKEKENKKDQQMYDELLFAIVTYRL